MTEEVLLQSVRPNETKDAMGWEAGDATCSVSRLRMRSSPQCPCGETQPPKPLGCKPCQRLSNNAVITDELPVEIGKTQEPLQLLP